MGELPSLSSCLILSFSVSNIDHLNGGQSLIANGSPVHGFFLGGWQCSTLLFICTRRIGAATV